MKVGGLQMERNGFGIGPADVNAPVSSDVLLEKTGDLYGFMIDSFGADRCMFESNFPVDKMGGASYHVLWNMFKKLCAARGTSEEDKTKLFYGTAAKVYKIGDKSKL